jgi:hypothetical protein
VMAKTRARNLADLIRLVTPADERSLSLVATLRGYPIIPEARRMIVIVNADFP